MICSIRIEIVTQLSTIYHIYTKDQEASSEVQGRPVISRGQVVLSEKSNNMLMHNTELLFAHR